MEAMMKHWLTVPALALAVGMAYVPVASADEVFKIEDFFKLADANRDSAVSRTEFMEAAGKRYDAAMARMKKMDDKGKPMVKGDAMTFDGVKMLLDQWRLYGGAGA
jgi:hypothetical protein